MGDRGYPRGQDRRRNRKGTSLPNTSSQTGESKTRYPRKNIKHTSSPTDTSPQTTQKQKSWNQRIIQIKGTSLPNTPSQTTQRRTPWNPRTTQVKGTSLPNTSSRTTQKRNPRYPRTIQIKGTSLATKTVFRPAEQIQELMPIECQSLEISRHDIIKLILSFIFIAKSNKVITYGYVMDFIKKIGKKIYSSLPKDRYKFLIRDKNIEHIIPKNLIARIDIDTDRGLIPDLYNTYLTKIGRAHV